MVKLGKKSPYVTSVPKSSRCSTCYKPSRPTPIPHLIDNCPKLPKDTPYQVCSPWPQFGGGTHLNQNWRSSPFFANLNGTLKNMETADSGDFFSSSPVIDSNGVIYCFSGNDTTQTGSLYSYTTRTGLKNMGTADAGDFFTSSPVIDSNGVIYCFSGNNTTQTGSLYTYV